jgi:Helix-turn-helix domain
VAEVEARLATLARQRVAIDDEQRQRFQHLGDDLAVVWPHPAAPVDLKKRIVRTVLQEIIIDTTQAPPEYRLTLHWQGGVHTELRVPRHRVGQHRYVTAPEVLELICELSKICQDRTIAATLNRLGYRTATGKTWRAHSVASMRYTHRLPHVAKGQEWLTLEQAAQQLGVSGTVIRRLIRHGTLPARQMVPSAPWIIHASDLALPAVQAEVQAVPVGHRPGQPASPAGDAAAGVSPAKTCSLHLMSGEL